MFVQYIGMTIKSETNQVYLDPAADLFGSEVKWAGQVGPKYGPSMYEFKMSSACSIHSINKI
jgi:hypothetical protein